MLHLLNQNTGKLKVCTIDLKGKAMLETVSVRVTHKMQSISLKNMYKNIVKLEWFAVVGLLGWLFVVFTAILH